MGCYDNVTGVPIDECHVCGSTLGRWQTKDGPCSFDFVDYRRCRNFYTCCDNEDCQAWHEYWLEGELPADGIESYRDTPTTADFYAGPLPDQQEASSP